MTMIYPFSVILLWLALALSPPTEYCEGWEDGYQEGYCHEIVNCVKPIAPVCPIPKIECREGYRCGYNRGFTKGRRDKESER